MIFEEIMKINLTKEEIIQAIAKAKEHNFIDNLRNRHINVQFDSKLRGYIGEISLKKWFLNNGIDIKTTNYLNENTGIDIDFEYKGLDLELKTSLIPDVDGNLKNVFKNRDIKIIKREKKIEDLKGDIHIQIFYNHNTKKKDAWLKKQNIDFNSSDLEKIYNAILGRAYLNNTYLFGWNDKPALIRRINALPLDKRTWSFAKRIFWVSPLRLSYPPIQLIDRLKMQ